MTTISFEEVLSGTIRSLEKRGFKLPPETAKAVHDYLAAARRVYLAGYLIQAETFHGYTHILTKRTHALLADPTPTRLAVNGYRLAERILCHHCRIQAEDGGQQERVERVARALQAQVAHKTDGLYRNIAAMYINVYCRLETPDLFGEDGYPIGRGSMAAKVVADRFKGQQCWRAVSLILSELRDLARKIDRSASTSN